MPAVKLAGVKESLCSLVDLTGCCHRLEYDVCIQQVLKDNVDLTRRPFKYSKQGIIQTEKSDGWDIAHSRKRLFNQTTYNWRNFGKKSSQTF